jgi:hypothetical protein
LPEENTFIKALIDGKHSIHALQAEFSSDDPMINLAELSPESLAELHGSRITPPEPITRYLASGDEITDYTIDQMELAMETAAALKPPFYITSMRSGEGTARTVDYFYLEKEV